MSDESSAGVAQRDRSGGGASPAFSPSRWERVRSLAAPVAAVVLCIFLYWEKPPESAPASDALHRIALSQKDRDFRIIPPARGGAVGSVWYSPRGRGLSFQLAASGLRPGRRYLLELSVDGTIYTVASHTADASGELSIDSTIATFAEGACVGDNFDPPKSTRGAHEVKFWLKNDGNPVAGTMPGRRPASAAGSSLPCRGNGDGDYGYVLLDDAAARFTGESS